MKESVVLFTVYDLFVVLEALSLLDSKLLCLMVINIHDKQWTVSNIFGLYLIDLLLKILEIYKKCSNSVNF